MSWLSLFLFLVMVGIIFFQSIHGMFGSIIMATLCVVCATLALGFHEMAAEDLLYDLIGDYAYGVSFVGIFSVSLIAARSICWRSSASFPASSAVYCSKGMPTILILSALYCT